MKTIFLFVDKPTFIGDLLKTNYLQYLSAKYKVILFTRNIDSETAIAEGYYQSPDITYVKYKFRNNWLFDLTKILRFSCIREFDYLATAKLYRHRRGQNRDNALLRIMSRPLANILTSRFFYRLELLLLRGSGDFRNYCQSYKPSLIITATPGLNNVDAEAIMLAKKCGIKSVSVDCNWDGLTTRVSRVRLADYFIAWHEPMRQEAITIHRYNPDRVFVSGPIRFDHHFAEFDKIPSRAEFLVSKGLNPAHKTVLYTTKKGYSFDEDSLRRVIDLRSNGLIPYVNIFIRAHPLSKRDRFGEFHGLKDLYLEQPPEIMSGDDLLNLRYSLLYSDVNINHCSTVSLEAILLDKPVINYWEPVLRVPEHDHYRPVVDSGAVRLVKDNDGDMIKAINDFLADPSLDRNKRLGLAQLLFPFRDGLSYKRSVDFLETIIGAN